MRSRESGSHELKHDRAAQRKHFTLKEREVSQCKRSAGYDAGTLNGVEVYKVCADQDVFEPKDDVKGDVARILLYVYCCWGQPNLYSDVDASLLPAPEPDDTANTGGRVISDLETLLAWCEDDPVDTWELLLGTFHLTEELREGAHILLCHDASGKAVTPKTNSSGRLNGVSVIENDGEIICAFFRSAEYKARDLSNTETVRLCYEAMLARAPDDEGLANWTALLDDGYSTTRLVAEFARSAAQATPALRTGCGALPR